MQPAIESQKTLRNWDQSSRFPTTTRHMEVNCRDGRAFGSREFLFSRIIKDFPEFYTGRNRGVCVLFAVFHRALTPFGLPVRKSIPRFFTFHVSRMRQNNSELVLET